MGRKRKSPEERPWFSCANDADGLNAMRKILFESQALEPLTDADCFVFDKRIKKGDEKAREELALRCLPLVMYLAFKMRDEHPNMTISMQDLVSEGIIGLLRAAKLYDPGRGARFTTFAYFWVLRYESEFLGKAYPIFLPKSARKKAKSKVVDTFNPALSWADPSALNDLPFSDVEEANAQKERLDLERREEVIKKALDRLSAEDREVILSFYGAYGHEKKTAEELGKERGLSPEAIYRLVKRIERELFRLAKECLSEEEEEEED